MGLRIQKFLQGTREGCLESSRPARYPSGRCSVVRHRLSASRTPFVERFFASAVRWHGERAAPLADARISPRVAERAPSLRRRRKGRTSVWPNRCQPVAHSASPTPSTPSSRIVRVASTTSKGLPCGGRPRRDAFTCNGTPLQTPGVGLAFGRGGGDIVINSAPPGVAPFGVEKINYASDHEET